jgi:hypothetical protein
MGGFWQESDCNSDGTCAAVRRYMTEDEESRWLLPSDNSPLSNEIRNDVTNLVLSFDAVLR